MTLNDLYRKKIAYEAKREEMEQGVVRGTVTSVEVMKFDIAHLNSFSNDLMLYLFTCQGDDR